MHILDKLDKLAYLSSLLSWEIETKNKDGSRELQQKMKLEIDCEYKELFESASLTSYIEEIRYSNPRLCEILEDQLKQSLSISRELQQKYSNAKNASYDSWVTARSANDYTVFSDQLKNIVDVSREIAFNKNKNEKAYNVMLDTYCKGYTIDKYDSLFESFEKELVPFVKNVLDKSKPVKSFIVNINNQKKLSDEIVKVMNFDLSRGEVSTSIHPFCLGLNVDDVRITTTYKNNPISNYKSLFHELGHARYEQGFDKGLYSKFLKSAVSSSVHESQSRFYEQFIATNKVFVSVFFPTIKEILELDVTEKEFYEAINQVEKSFIRVEADELTYPLHILLRYKIEKDIFENNLQIENLSEHWNKLYYDYFGVEITNDCDGILQDIHWGWGLFGYFPTYLLGTMIAAQLYYKISEELDVESIMSSGDLTLIHEWLNRKIHSKGNTVTSDELISDIFGEEVSYKYLLKYLKDKYSKIYGIEG